jgi:hypothetical protein
LRDRSAARRRRTTLDIPWLLVILISVGLFSFRSGVPGMRHDWVWPAEPAGLTRWFVDLSLSQWNPNGLGNPGLASFNLVLAPLALAGVAHVPTELALFVLLAGCFVGAFCGMRFLFETLNVTLEPTVAAALALSYALGPIAFQKTVAGHLFWLAAYAALPWFVASVWNGVRRDGGTCRAFGTAALLYAWSTTQIQFAVFDAIVMLAIALALGARPRAWIGVFFVLAIGMLHNANAIRGPFGAPETFELARSHATFAWERDMSTPFFDAAKYAGYIGYDRLALPPSLRLTLELGTALIPLGAVAGIAIARDRRALVFGTLGLVALFFVSGWDGPLSDAFSWALTHAAAFTVFRELYHAMAIYALCSIVLLGLALARLQRNGIPVAVTLAAVLTVPFWSNGLSRLVPALRLDRFEAQRDPFQSKQQVLLPYQQPITAPGLESGGIDPARFVGNDAVASDPPFALRAALDPAIGRSSQLALLADAGIAQVVWRPDRYSRLASSFEPAVGARFERFTADQQRLHVRYAAGVDIETARSAVELENPSNVDRLATFIADDALPPGHLVSFDSSYSGNGIRAQWVSGNLWSWFAPELTNVISEPVFSESSAPLALHVRARAGDTIYVLAATSTPRLDGRAAEAVADWHSGRYAWYAWRLDAARADVAFTGTGFSSVARCIVSPVADWQPPLQRSNTVPPTVLAYHQSVPWTAETTVPQTSAPMRLVFARMFVPGWHLRLDGVDMGEARRYDGIFMGWLVPPSAAPRSAELSYAPQLSSGALVAIDVAFEALLFAFVAQSLIGAKLREIRR